MNPLTNMKNVIKLSEQELNTNNKTSWHDQYRDSAWIFVGGLPFDLTEGDIICIFSQYGELVNINLIRDKDTGKSKGFCFLCYEDQRSTVLAVDNFNGIKLLNRILRVDHVSDYKMPKGGKKLDAETKKLYEEGCAPEAEVPVVKPPVIEVAPQDVRETLADQINADIKLPPRLPIYPIKIEPDSIKVEENETNNKIKKSKSEKSMSHEGESSCESENERKKRKKKKKSRRRSSSSDSKSEFKKKEKRNKKMKKLKVHKGDREKEGKGNRSDQLRRGRSRSQSTETEKLDKLHSGRNDYKHYRHRSRSRSSEKRQDSRKHSSHRR
ncbi:hypothetical protein HHI36_003047 [Cryptolaemus montrouzieri]|uniref:RRM domain-containing protein n=1 Tax=Cryptolaemus montrouzieri TaxID=559131 RepID=A0ABD2PCS9_9CUCU